ncbi:homoserine kinase [candidate division KSB1 bacterium]|nr:homoserine kinase [candidate division KSB1 bacterium]
MVKVKVPASTSNLGSGFDTFGLALQLYLTVEIDTIPMGLQIFNSGEGSSEIANDENNLVFKAVEKLFQTMGNKLPGLKIKTNNEIPLQRGLGSSAAAIIAGLICASELAGENLENDEILSIAADMEGHPDNVAACLYGGLTISCLDNSKILTRKIAVDESLNCVLMIPNDTISTKAAREVLPETVSHRDAVFNLQRSALLTEAFMSRNYEILSIAMKDKLHQPFRKHLIPGYDELEKTGYENGALGVCISGSGPTILGFSVTESEQLQKAWQGKIRELNIQANVVKTSCDNTGLVIE